MMATAVYRGPDDSGEYLYNVTLRWDLGDSQLLMWPEGITTHEREWHSLDSLQR